MKHKLLSVAFLAITFFTFAQDKAPFWKSSTKKGSMIALDSRMQLPEKNLYDLDVNGLKTILASSPKRTSSTSSVIISLPNAEGKFEKFSVYENSIMDPALASRYPEIKSYAAIGIDNPTSTVYFSVSPLGFKAMILSADKSAVFIEPISQNLKTYSVYRKSDKKASLSHLNVRLLMVLQPKLTLLH